MCITPLCVRMTLAVLPAGQYTGTSTALSLHLAHLDCMLSLGPQTHLLAPLNAYSFALGLIWQRHASPVSVGLACFLETPPLQSEGVAETSCRLQWRSPGQHWSGSSAVIQSVRRLIITQSHLAAEEEANVGTFGLKQAQLALCFCLPSFLPRAYDMVLRMA
jgi:hypothetical protein